MKNMKKACGILLAAGILTSGINLEAKADLLYKYGTDPCAGITLALNNYFEAAAGKTDLPVPLTTTPAPVVSVVSGYTTLGVAKVEEKLNVREQPTEDSAIVGAMPKNAGCEIIEAAGEWTKIQSGKVTGYVKSEFLYTGEEANSAALSVMVPMATVNTATLRVREQAGVESKVLTLVAVGESMQVMEDLGEWIKVSAGGTEGYVAKQFVTIASELPKAYTATELQYGEGVSDVRAAMVEYAKQFLGNKYVWGGTSLTNGTDCSGFTMSIYKHFGITINRTSREQAKNGTRIDISEARPGDLVFYAKGGTINHVVMYIGGGQVIHASSPKTGIRISEVNYRTPVAVVRIIND